MEQERTCKICGQTFPIEDFYLIGMGRKKRRWRCKYCFRTLNKEYRNKNQAKFRAYWRKASKDYWQRHSLRIHLRKKYNTDEKTYLKMVEEQKGKCKICGNKVNILNVDHDHKTGKIRGLLCRDCNLGIGHFKDNIQLLKEAINYLAG